MSEVGAQQAATPAADRAFGRTSILFLLCYVLAQADKQVMGLLAVPVQETFALSNAQLGFLQGVAFSIAYALGGLPIARLLDGGHRVRIAAACVALWSVATVRCGFAGAFLVLVIMRSATAVAEAGLAPAFFSILSQSDDRRRIARTTSAFMLAPFVGGGLVLLLGGWLLDAMSRTAGGSDSWRAVFVALGVLGLAIAPFLAVFAHEPSRPGASSGTRCVPPLRAVLAAIFIENRFLCLYFLGLTAFTVLLYAAVAWYPAYLVRRFGISASAAGGYAGVIYLVAGVLGTLATNLLATIRKDVSVASIVRGFLIASVMLVPTAIAMTTIADMQGSLAFHALYAFLSAGVVASMAVPIQLSLANAMQARGIAVFSLLTSAGAGSAGPLIVGCLVDWGDVSLGAAFAFTGGGAMVLASLLLLLAWRARHTLESSTS